MDVSGAYALRKDSPFPRVKIETHTYYIHNGQRCKSQVQNSLDHFKSLLGDDIVRDQSVSGIAMAAMAPVAYEGPSGHWKIRLAAPTSA